MLFSIKTHAWVVSADENSGVELKVEHPSPPAGFGVDAGGFLEWHVLPQCLAETFAASKFLKGNPFRDVESPFRDVELLPFFANLQEAKSRLKRQLIQSYGSLWNGWQAFAKRP